MRVDREREEEKDPMSISRCIYKEMKLQNGDRTKKKEKKDVCQCRDQRDKE